MYLIKETNEMRNAYETILLRLRTMQKTMIANYTYEPITKYTDKGNPIEYYKTTLTFADGTSTSVEAPYDKADEYTGFYICYAKHMAGGDNTINNEADFWIAKKPKKDAKLAEIKAKNEAEKARIAERDKKRREKQRIRLEAIRRKEQYDAAVLAEKKYDVPMDFKVDN